MPSRKILLALTLSTLALTACAPQRLQLNSATTAAPPTWAFAQSDVPVDPAYRFGQLPNGLRYVIRKNGMPAGTALVRMNIAAGSLDEAEDERGFAHFVEHMAFNGSTRVPEGEMIKLLERKGLAFGADTNASTGFEDTLYMLDLPRTDPELLDTALMLMRETASELTISEAAVARERGVILAERRDRNSFALRNFVDSAEFTHPGARYGQRLPIGTEAALNGATAQRLKAFWQREYVPAHTTVMVIGDFDPDLVETAIKAKFGDWVAAPAEKQPSGGPVNQTLKGVDDIYIDPALSEQLSISRHAPWIEEPDTLAQRRENQLRRIGYGILGRRFQRRVLEANPPFRSASISTGDVFKAGRTTTLTINSVDGGWKRGLTEAAIEYRRALQFGFSADEVSEQVAQIRTAAQNSAASADTRSNGTLLGGVLALINADLVPDTPANSLARLESYIPEITPAAVLAALKREIVPLDEPLLRFSGRRPPAGGPAELRAAWNATAKLELKPQIAKPIGSFAYGDFGPAGTIISDTRDNAMGIRQLRFANGVRLNLKQTDLEKDRIAGRLHIDGGNMLQTAANPRAVALATMLPVGGLGKHSLDELQTLLAGKTVSAAFGASDETFTSGTTTTRRDLDLQLQVLAAFLVDPGYRTEGEVLFRQAMNNYFAALRATPQSALSADIGAILSDNDPRFSQGKVEDFRALTFAKFKQDAGDRLANGAIEIGLAGDLDEDQAITAVARTLGALPPREPDFLPYAQQRNRPFTAKRTAHVLRHTGPKDQALLQLTWPTRDGEDPLAALQLQLLQRIVQIELTETLREKLGKAYSPGAGGDASRIWKGYGTFIVTASVAVPEIAATRAAISETIAALRDQPIPEDILLRARQPLLEDLANRLKTNGGWISYVERAQTKPDRIERYQMARERLEAITAAQLQALARQYLTASGAVEILVIPEGAVISQEAAK